MRATERNDRLQLRRARATTPRRKVVVRRVRRVPHDGEHDPGERTAEHEGGAALTLWDAAITTLLKVEGGYVNHPDDPGGETKWGISKRSYPHLSIKNLTRDDAISIYRNDYWERVPTTLPDGLRWMVFDTAVNSGVQRALGWLDADDTLASYTGKRLSFLAGLSTWGSFGRGWTNRISHVLNAIHAFESGREDDRLRYASTLVLHGLRIADRWLAVSRDPVVLRGEFAYRVRGVKVDVRRVK